MARFLRYRPTPAMAVALTALFVALSGTGYAVTLLNGRNLVNRSVPGVKLKRETLGSVEIAEWRLGKVPAASSADAAARAQYADVAGRAIITKTPSTTTWPGFGTVNPCSQFSVSCTGSATATCVSGEITGGGFDASSDALYAVSSRPSGNGWTVKMGNADETYSHSFTVYTVCMN